MVFRRGRSGCGEGANRCGCALCSVLNGDARACRGGIIGPGPSRRGRERAGVTGQMGGEQQHGIGRDCSEAAAAHGDGARSILRRVNDIKRIAGVHSAKARAARDDIAATGMGDQRIGFGRG